MAPFDLSSGSGLASNQQYIVYTFNDRDDSSDNDYKHGDYFMLNNQYVFYV